MMAKGLHENAAWLSIDSTCPSYECNVRLGWGTKELPIDTVGQTLERWCVEVLYKNNQTKEKGKAALEIVLTNRDNDNPNNWKVVNTEYEADCGTMK